MQKKNYFEKYRSIILVVLLIFGVSCVSAQNEQNDIYQAYIKNDMAKWKKTIDAMNAEQVKSNERTLELLNYEYGYISWCMNNKRKNEAKPYLERAEQRIKLLMNKKHRISLLHAYQSAMYGFRIANNKLKAPLLGSKSLEEVEKSLEIDPNNAFGYTQLGNMKFFKPAMFGGSKKEAVNHYIKTAKLMQKEYKNNWNYLNLILLIAKCHEATDNIKLADAYYKKLLELEPNFSWLKDELYPEFKRKHKIK